MKGNRTVWLVGMMGAGKSSVGPALARRLGLRFVDLDAEIERNSGRSIPEIFESQGEGAFRALEAAALERVAGGGGVVALGGGALSQPRLRERVEAAGTLVYLRAVPETLRQRLDAAENRPLLAGLGPDGIREKLSALLAEREPDYARAAIAVDTDRSTVGEVVDRIAARLGAGQGDTALRSVEVKLAERSYPILLGAGNLPRVGSAVAPHTSSKHAVLISVPPVARRYAAATLRSLREAGLRTHRIDVPDGDSSKNLRQLAKLYEALLDRGADRGTVICALGGGMVGDLAGFAAASFLRGLPFVQIPTTLLAMVDASIGGKVGVNLPRGKNLVGAFHQPRLVWIDVETLRSLPQRQRAAGFAEVVKVAALWDAELFERLERDAEALLELDPEPLLPVLERACAIKAEIVARDEQEADLRMLLNLGHTLAHAVETLTRYRKVLHGEAVSMGMVYAARRSEELGFAPAGTAGRIEPLLQRFGLPTELPGFARKAYLAALRVDKKKRESQIRYVVLRGIGRAEAVPLAPAEILPPKRRGSAGSRR